MKVHVKALPFILSMSFFPHNQVTNLYVIFPSLPFCQAFNSQITLDLFPTTTVGQVQKPYAFFFATCVVFCSVVLACLSCVVLCCLFFSCVVLCCVVMCYLVLCCVLCCVVWSYLFLSCLVVSCFILSWLILSCLVHLALPCPRHKCSLAWYFSVIFTSLFFFNAAEGHIDRGDEAS
jgi:hypothetical protein